MKLKANWLVPLPNSRRVESWCTLLTRVGRRGGTMEGLGLGLWWVLAVCGIAPVAVGGSPETSLDEKAAVVVRLVHPDRQAAEVLRLFEGSRSSHPAAA